MNATLPASHIHVVRLQSLHTAVPAWAKRLQGSLSQSIQASHHTVGHLEETLLQQTRDLQRQVLEEAAQKKADAVPPRCPHCGSRLTRRTHGHARTVETRFGPISVRRTRGWCKRCGKWRFPADDALGLADTASCSPAVQEMAALTVSKLTVTEACAVLERVGGVKLARATLDREARRQGEAAQRRRQAMDERTQTPAGAQQVAREVQLELPFAPFTLVIEIDAWNIRERDQWGATERLRQRGEDPSRWHWVYGATMFRLGERVETAGGRRLILSRGTVMTRAGIDALREQVWAEAVRQGLLQAERVLVVADGAAWIWNLVNDRFGQAAQRLDFYHAAAHLWTVAEALHGEGTAEARAWVQPLLRQIERGSVGRVIEKLDTLLEKLPRGKQKQVEAEAAYLRSQQKRMDYGAAKRLGEPLGSGAIESTCRQYQCRFKRTGQFWTERGDEALLCLETFWRNGRWQVLYPHVGDFDLSKN